MTKRRKPVFVSPVGQTKSDINVTPLVDVVLVLLIIFMVVMPLLEKDLAVRIPADTQLETETEPAPDQIVVRVERSGALTINGETIDPAGYVAALETRLAARPSSDRVVFVSPEDDAQYKKLVEALDGARRAGAQTLGMLMDPVLTAPQPPP